METKRNALTARDMAYIAMMAALTAVCSWISIPAEVPFTLQLLALFAALGLLGGKRGMLVILVYLLMGAVGLPVFSGFSGGLGRLLGVTGGYMVGWIFMGLLYWLLTALLGEKTWVMALAMLLGLCVCYAFGTAWFVLLYTKNSGSIGFGAALMKCVVPFILPDLGKIVLAIILTRTIRRHVKLVSAA